MSLVEKPCGMCGKYRDEDGNEPQWFRYNWWHEGCADFDLIRKQDIEDRLAYGWDEGDRF